MIAAATLFPVVSMPFAHADPQFGRRQGMTMKKKAVLLGGAALLYFLYKKHQAKQSAAPASGRERSGGRQAQLYRSKNGGVYYRDARGKAVWLTVPSQPMSIAAEDVQRYAPDYARYRGPAPSAPRSYRTQQFVDFDGDLMENSRRN